MDRVLKVLFDRADKDGNGNIDYSEFAAELAHANFQEFGIFGANDDETGIVGHVVLPGVSQLYINDNLAPGKRVDGTGVRIQGSHVHGNYSHARNLGV